MRHNPRPQEMYRHFKGDLYQIRCLAKHTETEETLVVYQAMYGDFEVYARPLAMFMEEVDRDRYPSARQKYRFELLDDLREQEKPRGTDSAAKESAAKKSAAEESTAAKRSVQEKPQEAERSAAKRPQEAERSVRSELAPQETETAEEQLNIDPLVLEFLDADSYGQRLSILDTLHNRITDDMINMMAMAADLEIKDGELEDRYMELRNCLRTFEKYECNRLR